MPEVLGAIWPESDLPIVTRNLRSGQRVVFTDGVPLHLAVAASSSAPHRNPTDPTELDQLAATGTHPNTSPTTLPDTNVEHRRRRNQRGTGMKSTHRATVENTATKT